ncbi:MAG TPA: hypothetical protein VKA31_07415, partial [Mariprofundaceae bacterium]|nr:hypothetical protein [Mariprofundaceae bacterium]
MTPEQKQAYRERLEGSMTPVTPTTERTMFKAGQKVTDFAETLLPADPAYREAVGRQLGEGIGSMIAGLPAAWLGPVPATVFFGSGGSGEAVERAIQHDKQLRKDGKAGLTEEQIATAALWGIGPGATDVAPIELLLGRLKIPKPFQKIFATAIGRIGGQAFVEGVQEGGQQFLQNFIAQEIYNPDQSLTEGVVSNTALGGGVGGLAQGAKEAAKVLAKSFAGRKRGGQDQPPPSDDDLTLEEIAKAIDNPQAGRDFVDEAQAAQQGQQVARETKQDKLDVTEQAVEAPVEGAQGEEAFPKLAEEGRLLKNAIHPDWRAFAKQHGHDAAAALASAQMNGENVTLDEILRRAKVSSDERSADRAAQGIPDPQNIETKYEQSAPQEDQIVSDSAFNGDILYGLERVFGNTDYDGSPVPLVNVGFSSDEVEGLRQMGIADENGAMSPQQFIAYQKERDNRISRNRKARLSRGETAPAEAVAPETKQASPTPELAQEQQSYEQETILPAIEELDAEVGSPVLADAYSRLTADEKTEIISRISENEEDIANLIEEMAIRNEDAPTIAAMAIRRGATPEQIEQLRGVIQQASPELATVFDELVASLPKPRQAKARKPAAPVSKAGRSVISRLEGIGKQAELRSAVEDLGPTLKADEWKSVAYEVTG